MRTNEAFKPPWANYGRQTASQRGGCTLASGLWDGASNWLERVPAGTAFALQHEIRADVRVGAT